uniref:C1q domain-containing protein n=2 Tax=Magallana gigas TaxID=29159 RepID=A0A8W8LMH3_MAGGI|nr:heavy metal-binding protein HIP-like [Crassostrea gigas]
MRNRYIGVTLLAALSFTAGQHIYSREMADDHDEVLQNEINQLKEELVAIKDTIDFQSSLTKTLENMKKQETVIFDKVSLNEGNAYDKTSGVFTAPSDGIYSFSWTILTKAGKYFVSEIVQNGQKVAYNNSDGRGHLGWPLSTSHANIKMKKGDKVWIRTKDTTGHYAHGDDWCCFSGIKL